MTTPGDLAELVRAPAALTVLGDTLVGAASARGSVGARGVALSASSACIYLAGMALNDYADADLDAVERPERPIPSGRVSREMALGVGAGLTAAGIGLAFGAGRAHGRVSLALAASVWAYDLLAKSTPAGPPVMAVCRGLDVLMGAAGPGWRRALLPAGLLAVHTGAVTTVSMGEVHGTSSALASGAAAVTVGTAATIPFGAREGATAGAIVGAAVYAGSVLPPQLDAAREPTAANARTATRQGIRGMVPLQTALVARTGHAAGTAVLLAVQGVSRLIARARTKGDVT
ncbi:SCO3242 family prenyltransferase [Georgenia sp. Z1344]|uniref:SCO3242 family prenyltransferase n=1 Tax=Georgenia sp. Z1344 TaxID=3416706 RepID=UPI003CE79C30